MAAEVEKIDMARVFGADCMRRDSPLFYYDDRQKVGTSARLVHALNNIIVITYIKLKKQDFYFGHREAITALEVSSNYLVASAEFKHCALVNVWDLQKCLTIQVLGGMHFQPVTVIRFLFGNRVLCTLSHTETSS